MPDMRLETALDIGITTFNAVNRDLQYTLDHHDYPLVRRLYKSKEVDIQTGKQMQSNIVLGRVGNAKHESFTANDVTDIKQIQREILTPWRTAKTSCGYYVQEALVQNGAESFISTIKASKTAMWLELATELERKGWFPPATSSDVTSPRGIFYWLPLGVASAEGFAGKNPYYKDGNEITAGKGGIPDSDALSEFRSYYAQYTNVEYDDFLEKLDTAFRLTHFQAPVTAPGVGGNTLSDFEMYTNNEVLKAYTRLSNLSDDKMGFDLGKYHGKQAFNQVPISYLDLLDSGNAGYNAATSGANTLIGINWNHFTTGVLKGDNFRETPFYPQKPINHNRVVMHIDLTYNMYCDNPKHAGFVLSTTGK